MALSLAGATLAAAGIGAGSSLLGGYLSGKSAESSARKERQFQREFAQHGIRWRAADAKAAGLHPLAALGAQTTSYQPVRTGAGIRGKSIAQAGQQIARGVRDYASFKERELTALQLEDAQLDIEYKHLRNDALLMSNMGQATLGPGGHSDINRGLVPGQAVDVQPDITTAGKGGLTAAKDRPAEMWADVPNPRWGYVKIPTLTQQLTESLEDNLMFKIPYYATKIDTYFQGFAQKYGRDAKAKIKWMGFWNKHLPQPDPGKEWTYHVAGFFHQQKAGTLAREAAHLRDTRRQDRLVDEGIIP